MDAGADSGAGGLEGLYDGADNDLPDFFMMGNSNSSMTVAGNPGGLGDTRSATAAVMTQRKTTANPSGLGDDSVSLFDPLAAFGGEGKRGEDILASLGLPSELQDQEGGGRGVMVGGVREDDGGHGGDESFGADQSDWARMQKQFEDMNKSFLQE